MITAVSRWRTMRDDRGATLMELLVGMGIMMIFLGIFTGAILMLYQASNKANAVTASAGQTDQAFAHLDNTVRYASAISTPGTTSVGWYVEFLSTGTGTPICTQLRVNAAAQQLQARTWTVTTASPYNTSLSAFVPWGNGIVNGGVLGATTPPVPFTLIPPGTTNTVYEQLAVALVSASGSPSVQGQTNTTFTAVNSATAATSAAASTGYSSSVCNQVVRP